MKVIENVQTSEATFDHVVLTVGSFDGVHLGHRSVIDDVIRRARAVGGTAALLTMRPHPRELFSPKHAPNLLTSDDKKLQLLETTGIDVVFLLKFNTEVANLEPDTFVEEILVRRCQAKEMVVGHDFTFGKHARGDYSLLKDISGRYGFEVTRIPPVQIDRERVSSTLIRERILQGDLDHASRLLGRKYSVVGEVVPGRGIATRLGFPTANIRPYHSAIPAQGVYIAEGIVAGSTYAAAVNIGIAPTIRHEDVTVEAFLLDFDQNILGQRIEVVFHKRLRPERKFPSHHALAEQIARDVETVRRHFVDPANRGS